MISCFGVPHTWTPMHGMEYSILCPNDLMGLKDYILRLHLLESSFDHNFIYSKYLNQDISQLIRQRFAVVIFHKVYGINMQNRKPTENNDSFSTKI